VLDGQRCGHREGLQRIPSALIGPQAISRKVDRQHPQHRPVTGVEGCEERVLGVPCLRVGGDLDVGDPAEDARGVQGLVAVVEEAQPAPGLADGEQAGPHVCAVNVAVQRFAGVCGPGDRDDSLRSVRLCEVHHSHPEPESLHDGLCEEVQRRPEVDRGGRRSGRRRDGRPWTSSRRRIGVRHGIGHAHLSCRRHRRPDTVRGRLLRWRACYDRRCAPPLLTPAPSVFTDGEIRLVRDSRGVPVHARSPGTEP
jgi:hypothetical protein